MRMSAETGEKKHSEPSLARGIVAALEAASPAAKLSVETTGIGLEQFHTVR